MRLITKYNKLQEDYHNLQLEFTRSEIEKANLRSTIKDLNTSVTNARSGYEHLKNKIEKEPESILYHIKMSKIENYIRKSKLRKITSK